MIRHSNNTRPRNYWKNDPIYQRVLEILQDYWIDEPEEALVKIEMFFEKANGEAQEKSITWKNPELEKEQWENATDFRTLRTI